MMLSTSDSSYNVGTNLARILRISDPKKLYSKPQKDKKSKGNYEGKNITPITVTPPHHTTKTY
jgi:hypothetical protein